MAELAEFPTEVQSCGDAEAFQIFDFRFQISDFRFQIFKI
jgi:hypothetical protein